jgi:hypothetical protein
MEKIEMCHEMIPFIGIKSAAAELAAAPEVRLSLTAAEDILNRGPASVRAQYKATFEEAERNLRTLKGF